MGSSFTEKFEFSQDYVFRGSKRYRQAIDLDADFMVEGAMVQWVAASEINIGLEHRFQVENIEMPSMRACEFGLNDLGRRKVVEIIGKSFGEGGEVSDLDFKNQVDVVSESGLAIGHRGHRTGD